MTENAPAPQPAPGPGEEGYRQDPTLRPGEESYVEDIAKAKAMGQAELAVHDDIIALDQIADRAWGILNDMEEDKSAELSNRNLKEQQFAQVKSEKTGLKHMRSLTLQIILDVSGLR